MMAYLMFLGDITDVNSIENNQRDALGALHVMQEEKEKLLTELCPYFETCDMIQGGHERFPELVGRFKQKYCSGNHTACSRRWVWDFLGVEKVPELMMPQQHDWAQQILTDSGVAYNTFREKFPKP